MEAGDWLWQRDGREKVSGRPRRHQFVLARAQRETATSGGENDAALGSCEETDGFCSLGDGRPAMDLPSFPLLHSSQHVLGEEPGFTSLAETFRGRACDSGPAECNREPAPVPHGNEMLRVYEKKRKKNRKTALMTS